MSKIRGNKTLSGTWGELWLDGIKVLEVKKVEVKITINREDIQLGTDIDSKITGFKGEGTFAVQKVYSRAFEIFEKMRNGEDYRAQLITKLADPDAVNKQMERYAVNNVWFTELMMAMFEIGAVIEEEFPFGFTPTDIVNLDKIA